MSIWEQLLNLFFPPKCPFCRRILDSPGVCDTCRKELPWTEEHEAVREGTDGLRCAAPLWYEGKVREAILRLKFYGAAATAETLGALMAQCAAEHLSGEFDLVTWVPVSRKRRWKRGYDQAELLARAVCRAWGVKPAALLRKTMNNPAQSGLKEDAARRANVLGVYEMRPGAEVSGRRVLLIDDVCTTGATLTECSKVLREAGADAVVCVCVAHARRERDRR
jgi:ComF family protein|nr:ComF family protein [uncultured Oscillibacter sp.]